MKISFIGSGNVATQLALALYKKDIFISQIISTSLENARALAQKVNAQATTDITQFDAKNTDILLIAATDDNILNIATKLTPQTNVIVAHTSGSVEMNVLIHHENHGVFYPFISMQKSIPARFFDAPFLIEANEEATANTLKKLAHLLSNYVLEADSQQRQNLHLAAVFANNFVNNQLAIAETILAKNHLPFSLLRPLLADYFGKLENHLPHELQTGPAVRHDSTIIEKHVHLLRDFPEYQTIYRLLTEDIQREK